MIVAIHRLRYRAKNCMPVNFTDLRSHFVMFFILCKQNCFTFHLLDDFIYVYRQFFFLFHLFKHKRIAIELETGHSSYLDLSLFK